MNELKRSNDRKTANMSKQSGDKWQSKIKNAFGLPAGKEFSCVGETPFCGGICYGKRIEGYLPSVSRLLMHNWELVRNKDTLSITDLLIPMMLEFVEDCDKHGAEKMFRIHWDGDFFSPEYTYAWSLTIRAFPEVQFWAYTRNAEAARFLHMKEHPNLGLYFSMDRDNSDLASELRTEFPTLKIATLHTTFDEAKQLHLEVTGSRVGKCPEVASKIPLISQDGGACKSCSLCPTAKVDITFATSGR